MASPPYFVFTPSDKIVFVGDSITEATWWSVWLTTVTTGIGSQPTVVNSGVGGNKVSDIEAAVTSRITTYSPTVVVMLIGVNDVIAGTSASAYAASYRSVLAQTLAAIPSVKIACLSMLCNGEKWPTGANATDTDLTAKNVIGAAAASDYGCVWLDVRTPLMAYEAATNPTNAETGILTTDGIHLRATVGTGFIASVFTGAAIAMSPTAVVSR